MTSRQAEAASDSVVVVAVAVFMVASAVVRIVWEGLTVGRIGMCIGAIFVLVSYPTLRSDVREAAQHADEPPK